MALYRHAAQNVTSLPDLYSFAAFLGKRFGCTHFVDVEPTLPHKLLFLTAEFQVVPIERRNENLEAEALGTALLSKSVIMCAEFLERSKEDPRWSDRLRTWLDHAPVCVLSTDLDAVCEKMAAADVVSTPVTEVVKHVEEQLRTSGFNVAFVGLAKLDEAEDEKNSIVAVLENNASKPVLSVLPAPPEFRVVAIMTAYNEEDIIVHSINHLIDQGIDVYLIDNWSTDATYELAKQIQSPKLLGIERFPQAGPPASFQWKELLKRKEEIAQEIKADWFIHHDADEIRLSPWPGVRLRDAVYAVDQAGFNCIDHAVIEFPPVDNGFQRGEDFEAYFRHFEFDRHPASSIEIKAWKNLSQRIALADSGGHEAQFEGRRMYPYKFLIKHYPIRSQAHGQKKVFVERKGRWDEQERAAGWHVHYDYILEGHFFLRTTDQLRQFDDAAFYWEYLAERLAGITMRKGMDAQELVIAKVTGKRIAFLSQAVKAQGQALSSITDVMRNLQVQFVEKQQAIATIQNQLEKQRQLLQQLHASIAESQQVLQDTNAQLVHEKEFSERLQSDFEVERQSLTQQIHEKDLAIQALQRRNTELEVQFKVMQASLVHILVSKYRLLLESLLPNQTRRRRIYNVYIKGVRILITEGILGIYRWIRNRRGKMVTFVTQGPTAPNSITFIHEATTPSISPLDRDKYAEVYDYVRSTAAGGQTGDYVPLTDTDLSVVHKPVKLIAFYLPQYHPIPENDQWWGRGFTEWSNVSKAAPQFLGHYQPHLPGELGYYDLRVPEVQRRQVELAKKYGIYGFCFYYYWFHGKRLLEGPLEQFLKDPKIDFPFCLCWANENWTRRWDGMEHDILIAQEHSVESNDAFIKDIAPILQHERYLRIQGRPLLIVYRANLLPDPAATAKRWKEYSRQIGIGELYLVAAQTFGFTDPRVIGFDAAVEFPPHSVRVQEINHSVRILNEYYAGKIFSYLDIARQMTIQPNPPYQLFKTVFPAWDNEPRRPGHGHTFALSTPDAYKDWLTRACQFAMAEPNPEKRVVFINAWNEWAEGAYLEPDRKYGYAYLNKTAEALSSFLEMPTTRSSKWKVLFVSHDACIAGAQAVLLNNIAWLKRHSSIEPLVLCLEGGEWIHRFRQLGETLVLSELTKNGSDDEELYRRLREFCDGSVDLVYCNSVASGRALQLLSKLQVPIVTHFHELQMSIKRYANDWIGDVLRHSAHFIACSGAVSNNLVENHRVDASKITTVYSSINPDITAEIASEREKNDLRKRLHIEQGKFLIFGCGMGMVFRKGGDLFIGLARTLLRRGIREFHCYWIGDLDKTASDERLGSWLSHLAALKDEGIDEYVTFLEHQDAPREYLMAGDLFVLPSREDPFPLVVLEAAECGLPIICFDGAGGTPDFVEKDVGFVVPYEDIEVMAEKVAALMRNDEARRKLGARARQKVLSRFTIDHTAPYVLAACRQVAKKKPPISVIVPNYNHASYLPKRLDSIFNQSFRDFEIILLDDASTDNSNEVLAKYADAADVFIVRNEQNSGSPFKQWLKGIDLARADILWIAESDDMCDPRFLETLLQAFQDPEVKLAYSDSHVIDENGSVAGCYADCDYLTSLSETKWKQSYQASATQEINDGLGIKNTILNISGVLFKKFEFDMKARKTLENMRIAGDWYFIAHAIQGGEILYDARKLNYHRRHSGSVIGSVLSGEHIKAFFHEFYLVQNFILQNYGLREDFYPKWENYLRTLWRDFYPEKPFEGLNDYYPVEKMREFIKHKLAGA